MKSGGSVAYALLLILLLLLAARPARAFYDWQGPAGDVEMRGLLRVSAIAMEHPDDPSMTARGSVNGVAASGRLMLDAAGMDMVSFEVHAVQDLVPLRLQTGGNRLVSLRGVERSDWLDWRYADSRAYLQLDRLNVQLAGERLNIKAGRQPVSLAATFYFTPNDFFAPFAAQTFFRVYKPGVDAVRADLRLGALSQFSLISVLGYHPDPAGDTGWSSRPDLARTSCLARASVAFGDFEWAGVGGVVRRSPVLGVDFQGELLAWLGVRGEGHVAFPDNPDEHDRLEFSLGLEHRWESSLTLRLEQFYHGGGATSVTAYGTIFSPGDGLTAYLARHYTAFGASYEFTPLLNGDMTAIRNWVDDSGLLALYAVYSLSDESELAINANMPIGATRVGTGAGSEFGLYPFSLNIEARVYF